MSIRTHRLSAGQMYGPTSYATASFPAGVYLDASQWAKWQSEATVQAAANERAEIASAASSAAAIPAPAVHSMPAGISLSSIPKWGYWAAGGAALLLLFSK